MFLPGAIPRSPAGPFIRPPGAFPGSLEDTLPTEDNLSPRRIFRTIHVNFPVAPCRRLLRVLRPAPVRSRERSRVRAHDLLGAAENAAHQMLGFHQDVHFDIPKGGQYTPVDSLANHNLVLRTPAHLLLQVVAKASTALSPG